MKFPNLICLLIFLSVSIFGQIAQDKVRQNAEIFVAAYNAKDYARIEKEFNGQMAAAVPSDRLKGFLDENHVNLGRLVKLGAPNFVSPTIGVFPAEFERGKMSLIVTIDENGKVSGLRLTMPQTQKPRNTARNQTKMSLPLKGEWFVFWGGDTARQNYHQDSPNQRFAFDLVKTDAGGKSYGGAGTKNEDYYAFGQEIVAPADGTIVYVVDGIHDNVPGEMNRMFAPGNTVVIKHAENEYSLLAHFKQNSIRVKVGVKVAKGQLLGLCGNSGNSSGAHLHFQVQNTPFFSDEASMKVFLKKLRLKPAAKPKRNPITRRSKARSFQINFLNINYFESGDL